MKCIILDTKGNKTNSVIVKNKYSLTDVQLSVINEGAISISNIVEGDVENTLILHTTATDVNAIDLEHILYERTNIRKKNIKLINIDELIESVIPKTRTNFTSQLLHNDYGFINFIKTNNVSNAIRFKTILKFDIITMAELREQLMNFVQQISKMSFYIERNPKTIIELSEYLSHLRMLTQKQFDLFSASQFQQVSSVAKHASTTAFNECYYQLENSNSKLFKSIYNNIELIKKITKDRISLNFKGMKIYITSKTIAFNLLGTLFNNPNATILNICLAHILMCDQLVDFNDKLERSKLLNT